MRFIHCPHCGQKLIKKEICLVVKSLTYIHSYPYDKKEMLMLGYKAVVDKADFKISQEVDSVQWFRLDEAPSMLREGSIAWQLVNAVIAEGI